jgi:hypothetical protein
VAVETKALRQPNAVADSLTAQKPSANAAPAAGESKSDVNVLVEALKALAAAAQQQQQQQGAQGAQAAGKP